VQVCNLHRNVLSNYKKGRYETFGSRLQTLTRKLQTLTRKGFSSKNLTGFPAGAGLQPAPERFVKLQERKI
jgi:hypothetical protein